MATDYDPEPKVKGYVDVRHKQGEATKITLTVAHFVDTAPWEKTEFVFDVDGAVASIRSVKPEGDTLHVRQNRPAREKAYEAVENLPAIEEVERLND